jgi:hypothetical protein
MPSITYRTELSVAQPWLIEAKSLEELDAVVDACIAKMREQRNREIEVSVEKYATENTGASKQQLDERRAEITAYWRYSRDERIVTIFLSGGRTAEGVTFKELMALPNIQNELPRGFRLHAQVGKTSSEISFKTTFLGEFEVRVEPSRGEVSLEIFGLIQNWVTEIQPPRWQQWWLQFRIIPALLLSSWVLFFLVSLSGIIPNGQEQLKQEARDLAERGVNSSNEAQALQLILAIDSEYQPLELKAAAHPTGRGWGYFLLISFVLAGLSIPPRSAIGMWGGRFAVRRQKAWLKIVSVTVPTLIISGMLLPWLRRILGWA